MTTPSDPIFYAWAAGFFDGEGSVFVRRTRSGSAGLRVQIGQVDRRPLDELKEVFGGVVASGGMRPSGRYWQWRVDGPSAFRFLEATQQYMRVKGDRAWIALNLPLELLPPNRVASW